MTGFAHELPYDMQNHSTRSTYSTAATGDDGDVIL